MYVFSAPEEANSLSLARAVLAGSPAAAAELIRQYQEAQRPIGEMGEGVAPRSTKTLSTYAERVRVFLAWCVQTRTPIDHVSTVALRAFAVHLFRANKKRATVKLSCNVARVLLRAIEWAGVPVVMPELPQLAPDPQAPHEKRVPPPWPELHAHLADLREAALHDGDRAVIRLAAAVHLMATSALRRGEVVGLHWSDVDEARRSVHVLGKGARFRDVPITKTTLALLQRLRLTSHALAWDYVIQRLDHPGPLNGNSLLVIVRDWERSIGLKLPAACHILRHAGLTEMARSGAPITRLRDLAGHRAISTTEIYIARASEEDKRATIDGLD